jgi:hypothetical protein
MRGPLSSQLQRCLACLPLDSNPKPSVTVAETMSDFLDLIPRSSQLRARLSKS